MPKATDQIIEQRVIEILPLVTIMNRREILQYCAKKYNWEINSRQMDNYIARAREILREETQLYKANAIESALNNLLVLYKKAFKKEDHRTCLAIQAEINKMFGLTQKIDLTSGGDKITGFTVNIIEEDKCD